MYEITFFFSVMECWEYQNKYDVADENGEQTFFLKEESSCLMRSCCANARELELSMQDMNCKELLRFDRPLKCMECPCDGCYPNWTQVRKIQIFLRRPQIFEKISHFVLMSLKPCPFTLFCRLIS